MTLPTGTVTFLLTDIVGSTLLWEAHPEQMRAALPLHDARAEEAVSRNSGVLVRPRGEGDSLFAVFARAADALAAAGQLQQGLRELSAGLARPLLVRMALHTGDADLRDGDYYGSAVNRCARLRALAHGGQILVSSATAALAGASLPEGASLKELGTVMLRDLGPERVFQLQLPDLPAEFPPLAVSTAQPNNLPRPVTSFIGREGELREIDALLGTARLLTLVGPGGAGKTRLTLEAAATIAQREGDGVWYVELASIPADAAHGDSVARSLVAAAGVRETPGRTIRQTLVDFLAPRTTLLLLDNCEHLLDDCARLAHDLLTRCPRLRILASSREPLGTDGETVFRTPPLGLPARDDLAIDEVRSCSAVALFEARARAVSTAFTLTAENATAVAAICRQLDGIPLAIELAAARVRGLTPQEIRARLGDRFALLRGGSRAALPRQQTLQALVDWSYDLLTPEEQLLLCRLAVFSGGWDLAAAEAVCAGGPVEPWAVLDLQQSLCDKSLVVADHGTSTTRTQMLATMREYARMRLPEHESPEGVRDLHLAYYTRLCDEAAAELSGPNAAEGLGRLETEYGNIREALAWAVNQKWDRRYAAAALSLCGSLMGYWRTRGYFSEGRSWLASALAGGHNRESPSVERGKALNNAGILAWEQGDREATRESWRAALAAYEALADRALAARTTGNLGILARAEGDLDSARDLYTRSLEAARAEGDRTLQANMLSNLGNLAATRGDRTEARSLHEESLTLHRELGSSYGAAIALVNLAQVLLEMGDPTAARGCLAECAELCVTFGIKRVAAPALEVSAHLANGDGRHADAAFLLGAAGALRKEMDMPPSAEDARAIAEESEAARSPLGNDAFEEQHAAGRAIPWDHALRGQAAAAAGPDEHQRSRNRP